MQQEASSVQGSWSVQTAPLPLIDPASDAAKVLVPPYGPRPNFLQSSQARHWMFSPEELDKMRRETHERARASLDACNGNSAKKPIKMLSLEDELAIIRFYLLRIGRLVRAFHLPSLVESTAMTFMKRFYLQNSCMQFHPKLIIIYLASKAENYPLSLSHFCAQVKEGGSGKQNTNASSPAAAGPSESHSSAARGDVSEAIIKDLEFGMVQSLNFELGVHGAHRALYGLILDFQTLEHTISREDLMIYAAAVQSFLQAARLTDAEFTYASPHIALAACYMCEVQGKSGIVSGKELVEKWIQSKYKIAAQVQLQQCNERQVWRKKKESLNESHASASTKKEQEPSSASSNPSFDYTESDLKTHGNLLPYTDLINILHTISTQILQLAPNTPASGPLKPDVDLEQARKIDLVLRECLALYESSEWSLSRKRSQENDDNQSKRQRTSGAIDSDED
ncbi:hypothetical protein MPSI1_003502 [Malassezia psittaci]|uniref:Cyclin C-terminal domain-containing protein n=1 Tax=Malassezia psittaci TaxID=1821823 RepID=A0AAF0FEX2_9BASI|nr:hypothetical protein MPSI1_003502 [Malassezia psittaci]